MQPYTSSYMLHHGSWTVAESGGSSDCGCLPGHENWYNFMNIYYLYI